MNRLCSCCKLIVLQMTQITRTMTSVRFWCCASVSSCRMTSPHEQTARSSRLPGTQSCRKCEKQSATCGCFCMLTLGATWASWRRWGSRVQGAHRFTHTYHSNQTNYACDGKYRRNSITRKIGATVQCAIVTLIEHEQAFMTVCIPITIRNSTTMTIQRLESLGGARTS